MSDGLVAAIAVIVVVVLVWLAVVWLDTHLACNALVSSGC